MKNQEVIFQNLGLIDYKEAWDYQEKLFAHIIDQKLLQREKSEIKTPNYVLFCEHPHVYTLGKSGHEEYLLLNKEELKEKNAVYYKINRGGDITYHGPGQIVGYPLMDLDNFFTDIHKYLRFLEEVIILTLSDYGLKGDRFPGYTGVWIEPENPDKARKICAMGVRCSRWVTMHGFAFNVNADLNYFAHIIPCGIKDKDVTSLEKEIGQKIDLKEVQNKILRYFKQQFQCSVVAQPPSF